MNYRTVLGTVVGLMFSGLALAADISGKWTADFDTQMGKQNYTYEFKVTGGTLTGTAKSASGVSPLEAGKVDGDTVTFVETLKIQDMEIKLTYTGKVVSANEIQFSRDVGGFATETLVAKRGG
jgi:hypothetical protein